MDVAGGAGGCESSTDAGYVKSHQPCPQQSQGPPDENPVEGTFQSLPSYFSDGDPEAQAAKCPTSPPKLLQERYRESLASWLRGGFRPLRGSWWLITQERGSWAPLPPQAEITAAGRSLTFRFPLQSQPCTHGLGRKAYLFIFLLMHAFMYLCVYLFI